MRNNFFIIIIIIFTMGNYSFAETFNFKTSEIEILDDGNLVNATNGKAVSDSKNLVIEAKRFQYVKNLEILKAFNGVAFIKSNNLKIEFNEIMIDQKNLIIEAKEKIKIYEEEKNLLINTDQIIYDRNLDIIKSFSESIINDKFNNKLTVEKFEYSLNDNILKFQNGLFQDIENNKINLELAYINTFSNKLLGKDVFITLNNTSFDEDNEPRLKGKSLIYQNNKLKITKGVFTTCKKTDKCPPWQLVAEKIEHDKKKQVISYKNAWLKIYDLPVVYFPKFFHPDPTVERKSGFLIPSINSSSRTSFVKTPYFYAISENKDMTLTPRLYSNNKILVQSEYRQQNKNSDHIVDISLFKEKDNDSKNHFFYEYNKNLNYLNFEESKLNFLVQKTSNDTYLKLNKIKSEIFDNTDILETSLNFDFYSDDFSVETEFKAYEDLNKNLSDRYEFILPRLNLTKKIDNKTKLDGNFSFNSKNLIKNYQTNIFEKINNNNLLFSSNQKITSKGFKNDYKFLIKNANTDSQNSSSYKDGSDSYLSGIFQFNSSLPLIKESNELSKVLKPKLSLKLGPDNSKNMSDDFIRFDVNNIYNLDRLSSGETVEGGASITYGNDFTIFDKINSRDIFAIKIANNLRLNENDDLPRNNQINQKTSNFFSEIIYSPNEIFTTKYNASTKNNLTDNSYENLSAKISVNNFVTSFDYLNENNSSEKNSYLISNIKYSIDGRNNISYEIRENKKTNLTEYYNFIYQYKNDCLAASIEYNKDYYEDRDIRPEENIFLKLTIIPFSETSSPNLKK